MKNRKPETPPLDWRHRTVDTLAKDFTSPFTGILHKAGAPVSVITLVKHGDQELQIGDPSAPALFINASWISYQASIKIHPFLHGSTLRQGIDQPTIAYDYLEAIMSAIIFAFTAIEAFANEEIPEDYQYPTHRKSGISIIFQKSSIERHIDLVEKLAIILPAVKQVPSPKGTKIWQDFRELNQIRDQIVHLKTLDRLTSKVGNLYPNSIWSRLLAPNQPNYPLIAKNMITTFADQEKYSWLKYCPVI